jgi:Domain of unknown function (DUF1707)
MIMDPAARDYYPPGDLRVSDAERDLALSELSEALQAGRITADEFHQRTALERAQRVFATRIAIGAVLGAVCFAAVGVANALSSGPTLQQREFLRDMLARQGLSVPVPPAQGFDWAGTITPGVIAVLLVVLIIFLRVPRADRRGPKGERPGSRTAGAARR